MNLRPSACREALCHWATNLQQTWKGCMSPGTRVWPLVSTLLRWFHLACIFLCMHVAICKYSCPSKLSCNTQIWISNCFPKYPLEYVKSLSKPAYSAYGPNLQLKLQEWPIFAHPHSLILSLSTSATTALRQILGHHRHWCCPRWNHHYLWVYYKNFLIKLGPKSEREVSLVSLLRPTFQRDEIYNKYIKTKI